MLPTIQNYECEPIEVLETELRVHTLDKLVAALVFLTLDGVFGFELNAPMARKLAKNLNEWAAIAEATGMS